LFIGLASSLAARAQAQQASSATAPTVGETRLNCGVNVGYFTLKWFDAPADIKGVGKVLNVGEEFEKPCSLEDLKQLFERNGLRVEALKADSNEAIVSRTLLRVAHLRQVLPAPGLMPLEMVAEEFSATPASYPSHYCFETV
jgi:hypothetical protein